MKALDRGVHLVLLMAILVVVDSLFHIQVVAAKPATFTGSELSLEVNGVSVEYEIGASTETLDYVQTVLGILPSPVVKKLAEQDWQIIVTHDNLQERFYPDLPGLGTVCGSTSLKTKAIYLNDDPLLTKYGFAHELGHAFDKICGYPSQKEEFKEIYMKEFDSFLENSTDMKGQNFFIDSPLEYFAAAFRDYVIEEEVIRQSAPETCALLDKLINSLRRTHSRQRKPENGFFCAQNSASQ